MVICLDHCFWILQVVERFGWLKPGELRRLPTMIGGGAARGMMMHPAPTTSRQLNNITINQGKHVVADRTKRGLFPSGSGYWRRREVGH